jgi:glycerol kinase
VAVVLAIDAGTTGVRTVAFDETGVLLETSYREIEQHYPRPGWVEHDANEIWEHVETTLGEVASCCRQAGRTIAAIGVTNQRETLVTWRSRTGEVPARAIVWQDRRSAEICAQLRDQGHEDFIRRRTGLVLDPYFSATKMAWLLGENRALREYDDLVMATVDSWVLWNLTGGTSRGVLVTDTTNASRTLLFDIHERRWSAELADLFGVPMSALTEVVPSCGRVGEVSESVAGGTLSRIPVSGIAGDQHAALFGQACFEPGMAKATNGTGSFVLLNAGSEVPETIEGTLTTVAWDLGSHSDSRSFMYAYEGSVFVTGAAIQWLRDELGVIEDSAEIGSLASSIPDTEGVFIVPAFTGLGSPWWDPYARGILIGLTGGVGRAHLARAVVESIAFQVRDVIDAMTAKVPLRALRVDGGASVMELLLQLLADQLQAPVSRPTVTETTALGAATLAGLAEGVWASLEELSSMWHLDVELSAHASREVADAKHEHWLHAVNRSRSWA